LGLLPEHFQGLLLDIQDERDSNGQTHTNRFIHFLHDKINAIMGNWGNQIRTAEKRLENHIHTFEHSFQDLDDRLEKFRQIFNTKILQAHEELSSIDAKTSYHLLCMQEHTDTSISRVKQATEDSEQ
jgi:hypothetical protein